MLPRSTVLARHTALITIRRGGYLALIWLLRYLLMVVLLSATCGPVFVRTNT